MLGISSAEPSPVVPSVPPIGEAVKGYAVDVWFGILAPAKTPAPVVAKLNAALAQVLAMPQVREFYRSGGYEAGASTPEEFAGVTRSTYERWGAMVQQVGLAKQ